MLPPDVLGAPQEEATAALAAAPWAAPWTPQQLRAAWQLPGATPAGSCTAGTLPAALAAPMTGGWGRGRLRWGTGPRPRPGVTFHFGEGQDRTVAGAKWGHPGRVLLHGELCACRSHDHLHPGAGREPSVPAASSVQERQARRPGPPQLPAVLLSPRSLRGPPRGAHLPRPQPLHRRAQPFAWRLLQTPTSWPSALPTPTRPHLLRPRPGRPCRSSSLPWSQVLAAASRPATSTRISP